MLLPSAQTRSALRSMISGGPARAVAAVDNSKIRTATMTVPAPADESLRTIVAPPGKHSEPEDHSLSSTPLPPPPLHPLQPSGSDVRGRPRLPRGHPDNSISPRHGP